MFASSIDHVLYSSSPNDCVEATEVEMASAIFGFSDDPQEYSPADQLIRVHQLRLKKMAVLRHMTKQAFRRSASATASAERLVFHQARA